MSRVVSIPTAAVTVDVRLNPSEFDLLERVISRMQAKQPALTIDDCIDAVFAAGLLSHLRKSFTH